jgi:hypothetical protein
MFAEMLIAYRMIEIILISQSATENFGESRALVRRAGKKRQNCAKSPRIR